MNVQRLNQKAPNRILFVVVRVVQCVVNCLEKTVTRLGMRAAVCSAKEHVEC